MELIEWINGITKLNKSTMEEFQNNISEAIEEASESGGDGILTGSIIGWNDDVIPEGYEEVENETNEAEDVTNLITDIHSKIDMNSSAIRLLKEGNVMNLRFHVARSGDFTTSDVLFKIPTDLCGGSTIYAFVVGGGGSTKRIDISSQGEVKVSGDASSTSWLGGNIIWVRYGGN